MNSVESLNLKQETALPASWEVADISVESGRPTVGVADADAGHPETVSPNHQFTTFVGA